MPPAEADRYTVEVAQPGPHSPWRWEIYRNGKPLPARLLKGDFGNRHAAKVAGNSIARLAPKQWAGRSGPASFVENPSSFRKLQCEQFCSVFIWAWA
jgi:hypothetical protein